jgi:hypothetical protein
MNHADCDRVRSLLSPSLDGELTAEANEDVSAHLANCSACLNAFSDIERGRQLATMLAAIDPPASLTYALLRLPRKKEALVSAPRSRRLALALATVGLALLVVVGTWQLSNVRQDNAGASSADAAAMIPLHLERLTEAVGTAQGFKVLAAQHQLREVNVEEALKRASFKVLCPLQADPRESLDERHLTELRACPLVHLSSVRGEHRIVVLQQPAGWPLVYGGAPVEQVTIAGQPCERLHIDGHEVLKWERGGTRSIMVAAADNPETTKVARALISAAS